jgi:hypothetical protein
VSENILGYRWKAKIAAKALQRKSSVEIERLTSV